MHLMLTQLRNQDPFKPMESGEFLGQLAQFGTVQGLAGLQTSFDSLASSLVSNQALQASSARGPLRARGDLDARHRRGTAGRGRRRPAGGVGRRQLADSRLARARRSARCQLGAQPEGLVPFDVGRARRRRRRRRRPAATRSAPRTSAGHGGRGRRHAAARADRQRLARRRRFQRRAARHRRAAVHRGSRNSQRSSHRHRAGR